ncbi:HK97-gp10 family putative phage morphogenesis protein [Devosia sp. A449]
MSRSPQLARFARRMKAIPAGVRAAVKPALDQSAAELVGTMKRIAPHEDGDLQGSIEAQAGKHELARQVVAGGEATTVPVRDGADAEYDYALAQELGTVDMPANPFFFPAFRLLRKRLNNRIRRSIRKAVKDAL